MRYRYIAFLLLLPPFTAHALNSEHCLKDCPNGSPNTNDVIQRPIYVLSNNGTTKFADWVAYKVDTANFGSTKTRNFKKDPNLDPSETLADSDYAGAHATHGYDRGHMAPLASFDGSIHWRDTNYLSNITPQHRSLNRGPWKVLEGKIRKYAEDWNVPVYVISGSLYDAAVPTLPNSSLTHQVPSGYYKVIATLEDGQVWATGFVFHQTDTNYTSYCDYWESVDGIEQRTGLDFLPKLSGSTERDVEAGAYDLWFYLGCE